MQNTVPRCAWVVRSTGAVLVASVFLALSSTPDAWADCASDPRATATVSGNVTTCSAIGLGVDTMVGSSSNANAGDANVAGTVTANAGSVQPGSGQEVDIALAGTPGSVVIDAVVVKGGNGYNTYTNSTYLPPTLLPRQHYIPPRNNGGNVPTISHWFVCYHLDPGAMTPEVPVAILLPVAAGAGFAAWVFVSRRRRKDSPAS
jgi:hypothetical protein